MITFKSVNDPVKPSDGIRILATRYRGRGMKKSRYSVWMPNLGPSAELLARFQNGEVAWGDFKKIYAHELLSSDCIDEKNHINRNRGQKYTLKLIKELSKKQTITLMCHCATDAKECHLRVLEKVLGRV
ncbi:MAG TPA: DUF488 family protein [Spirochaetota bacterium]|nr:DUF488 family protein [Spirochaetota bacterium]